MAGPGHPTAGLEPCAALETCLLHVALAGRAPGSGHGLPCPPLTLRGDSAFRLGDHSSSLDSREDLAAAWPPRASVSPDVNPEADGGFLSCTSLSRPPPVLSLQEVCHPAGPRQHQESDDRPRVRDAALPALLPQVQGGAAVDAGHGDTLHLQVSAPLPLTAGPWGCPELSPQFRKPTC